MPWTRDTTSGVLTHSGTTRDFWNPGSPVPALARIYADCATVAHAVGIMVPTTQDGRTGFRCGIDPSDTTKVMIRRVTFGVEAANLNVASHGVPSGVPFRLQVELIGDTITAKVIATGYPVVKAEIINNVAPTYNQFAHWGLVSAVNGAVVLAAGISELRAVTSEVAEVLVAVANGSVYLAFDESNISVVQDGGTGAFSPDSDVSLAVLDGIVYGVDGSRARKINVVARTCIAWGPDDIGSNWDITAGSPTRTGALPGAATVAGNPNARTPGTTTARVVAAHKGRIYLAGMDESPHAIHASAVRNPQMWDTGEAAEGRAFALGVDRKPGASHTILSLNSVTDNVLMIGMSRSIAMLIGDPIDGFPEIAEVASDVGISGLNAVTTGINGVNIAHSPDAGLLLVPVTGAPVPVSAPVLTELIQFERGLRDDYAVSLARDTQRHGTHVFLTRRNSTGSVHLWYDEKYGGFQPGAGGFFPEEYPDAVGPTCAVNWRGYVVLGGKTGYIWKVGTTDADDGAAIATRMPLALMNDEDVMGDTILSYLRLELSDDSDDVLLRIFGGATVESAYDRTNRELLLSRTINPFAPPLIFRLRSRALVAEISSSTAGEAWQIEAVDVETTIAPMLRLGRRTTAAAADSKCEPYVAPTTTPPPSQPTDGPGGGGSIAPPPGLGMLTPDLGGAVWYWNDHDPVRGPNPPPPPPPITPPVATPALPGEA